MRKGKRNILIAVILMFSLLLNGHPQEAYALATHSTHISALKDYVFGDENTIVQIKPVNGMYIVFLSICNTKSRALVFKGTGQTIESAWNAAEEKATAAAAEKNYEIIWVKADIVDSAEVIDTVDLNKEVEENYYQNFWRKGIAFDSGFSTAYLEAEVNGNKMLTYYTESELVEGKVDYDSILLNLTNINHYRKTYYGQDEIESILDKITVFTTTGFFCDENINLYKLYAYGLDHGRRQIEVTDDKVIETVIINASNYLYDMLQPNGEFQYGYFPVFDNKMGSYNILRHTGSIWSLINLYRMTNDEALIPKLDSSISYLLDGYIEYKSDDAAYVIERKVNEVKLGGNALAVIMLTEYMDVFKTDKYTELVRHLANGILELEDLNNGTYYHVLNFPDYSPKEEYRTVYYDGEATFALTRAYTCTKDQKYLDGAKAAVENFILTDYTVYRDHWVAYALNEITKYIPDERYYKFALQNVQYNLDTIYYQETSYHTYLELLMVSWQTYERLIESNIQVEYLNEFDVDYFAQTIYKRAKHMLNGYFYPEYAMYMKAPHKALNAFFVRHDNYRIRIDDIQHFIGGYYLYTQYYEHILPYLY